MDQLLAVEDIDGSFVPMPRADVVQVLVGSELVLVRHAPHVLNPTASLVWSCFDGRGDLDEIIDDLAAATGADADEVRSDVLELTRRLARMDVLEGVAVPAARPTRRTGQKAVEVGEELEPFSLPDLDGEGTEWASFRGRRALLVNWSPGCGFCVQIADELGRLQPFLEKERVELVFVTRGTPKVISKVFAEHGIDARTLLKGGGIDPFAGLGTPAAYLVDADGKVTAFAYGAGEVPDLVRKTAQDTEHSPSRQAGDVDRPRYLPERAAVCGGESRGTKGKTTEWAGSRAYRFGPFHVGIRYNSEATAEVLDRLFVGRAVDDPRTPGNYSVALYQAARGTRELNLLVRGADQLVRSRSAERVLRGLLAYLSADLDPPADSLLRLPATAAVRDGEALLLPAGLAGWVKYLQPLLARSQIRLADLPAVTVDPESAELVVPGPSIEHDPSVLADVDAGTKLGSEFPPVLPGRYPLRLWVVANPGDDLMTTGALAALVVAADMGPVPADGLQSALERVARLTEQVPLLKVHLQSPASLAKQVTSELR